MAEKIVVPLKDVPYMCLQSEKAPRPRVPQEGPDGVSCSPGCEVRRHGEWSLLLLGFPPRQE